MVLHNLTKCNTIQGDIPKLDRPFTWAAAQLQNGTGYMDSVGDPGTKMNTVNRCLPKLQLRWTGLRLISTR